MFFKHYGLDEPVDLHFESSGTKRLFHLLPQLGLALNSGVPAALDEVDGDLHVDIAVEVLDWFRSRETNPRDAQLFVTSHNVGLLDDLEKEEVFIVEKDGNGATKVHGAQDVRGLRRDARLLSQVPVWGARRSPENRLRGDAPTQANPSRTQASHLYRGRGKERSSLRAVHPILLQRGRPAPAFERHDGKRRRLRIRRQGSRSPLDETSR